MMSSEMCRKPLWPKVSCKHCLMYSIGANLLSLTLTQIKGLFWTFIVRHDIFWQLHLFFYVPSKIYRDSAQYILTKVASHQQRCRRIKCPLWKYVGEFNAPIEYISLDNLHHFIMTLTCLHLYLPSWFGRCLAKCVHFHHHLGWK